MICVIFIFLDYVDELAISDNVQDFGDHTMVRCVRCGMRRYYFGEYSFVFLWENFIKKNVFYLNDKICSIIFMDQLIF